MPESTAQPIRLLMVEDYVDPHQAMSLQKRLESLGVRVVAFRAWSQFRFAEGGERLSPLGRLVNFSRKIQWRLNAGPIVRRMNRDLLDLAEREKVHAAMIWRGTYFFPRTIRRLSDRGVLLYGYNNDNPFSPKHPRGFWRHSLKAVKYYHRYFAYRRSNIEAFRRLGAERVELMRSWYTDELHHPLEVGEDAQYDVGFLGHWEPDIREECIDALLDERGLDFRLFGWGWKHSRLREKLRDRLGSIEPARGEEYNRQLNRARIALVFLSRINRDTYTRRCFEIPATGTFMLSEYSDEQAELFRPGREAEYFRTRDEMLEKIRYYLAHPRERQRIAEAGRKRLLEQGHEAMDRAKRIVELLRQDLHRREASPGEA